MGFVYEREETIGDDDVERARLESEHVGVMRLQRALRVPRAPSGERERRLTPINEGEIEWRARVTEGADRDQHRRIIGGA